MTGRGLLEAGVFGTIALALHAAAFLGVPQGGGPQGAGAGGADLMTLAAASQSFAEVVARFDAPEVPQSPLALAPEPPEIALPRIELPDLVTLPPEPPKVPIPPQPEATPPAPETAETPPAPKARTEPSTEPRKATSPSARPSAGQAAQRAAGSGGGAVAGAGGSAAAAALSAGREQDLRAEWGASIRARIERRKSYPSAAGRASGAVGVRIVVGRDGRFGGVSLTTSSGNAALDQAALQAVQRAGRFPAAPKGLGNASYSFTLTMRFSR